MKNVLQENQLIGAVVIELSYLSLLHITLLSSFPFPGVLNLLIVSLKTCREYKILNVLDFTSKRKRMSVIVQDEDGQIFVYAKGADRSDS